MMCFPCELSLLSTAKGPRLAWQPVREIAALRKKTIRLRPQTLANGARARVTVADAPLEIHAEIDPGDANEFILERGVSLCGSISEASN